MFYLQCPNNCKNSEIFVYIIAIVEELAQIVILVIAISGNGAYK